MIRIVDMKDNVHPIVIHSFSIFPNSFAIHILCGMHIWMEAVCDHEIRQDTFPVRFMQIPVPAAFKSFGNQRTIV
jgi:hypothetical protein